LELLSPTNGMSVRVDDENGVTYIIMEPLGLKESFTSI
jgi:hypothetical protein